MLVWPSSGGIQQHDALIACVSVLATRERADTAEKRPSENAPVRRFYNADTLMVLTTEEHAPALEWEGRELTIAAGRQRTARAATSGEPRLLKCWWN